MPSRHTAPRASRGRKALQTPDGKSTKNTNSSPSDVRKRIDRPLPASETKHLDRLLHPVPGTEVSVILRQVSAVPADSTRTSTSWQGRRPRLAQEGGKTGQDGSKATPAGDTTLGPVLGSLILFDGQSSSLNTNAPDGEPEPTAPAVTATVETSHALINTSTVSTGPTGSTGTTGTTLWLSAQLLAAYLATLPHICHPSTPASKSSHPRRAAPIERRLETQRTTAPRLEITVTSFGLADARRPLALDLGSGVGYLPLCLAAWGWDVLATDIQPVLKTVLEPNVRSNLDRAPFVDHQQQVEGDLVGYPEHGRLGTPNLDPGVKMMDQEAKKGDVWVKELDWTLPLSPNLLDLPARPAAVASFNHDATSLTPDPPASDLAAGRPRRMIDLILSSDTVYHPPLLLPLFRTLVGLLSINNGYTHRKTACYLALERRDPSLVDYALEIGRREGLGFTQVGAEGLRRAMREVGWLGGEGEEADEGRVIEGGEDGEYRRERDHVDWEVEEAGEQDEGLAGWAGCEVWKVRLMSSANKYRQGDGEHCVP